MVIVQEFKNKGFKDLVDPKNAQTKKEYMYVYISSHI